MGSRLLSKLLVLYVLHFVMKSPILIHGQTVPCLFIMGDSLFDNGNNNYLITLAKSNYLPYGIDYPDGPTGRFSNGKIIPDFIAELLGFDKHIPPFATVKGTAEILKGVNYASGGGGILQDTGKYQGARISMNQQLHNHRKTVYEIGHILKNESLAEEHLNKGLYVISMGNNEYVNNYLLSPLYLTSTLYTPQKFASKVISQYSKQLKKLYKHGARKVVVYGLAMIGCIPLHANPNAANGSPICDESINEIVQPFNELLKPMIDSLNAQLDAAQFIMINATHLTLPKYHSKSSGLKQYVPCCTVSQLTGLCEFGQKICENRNEYFFWDNYHPSEMGNSFVASRSFAAESPQDTYPFDIRHLLQL